VKTEIVINEAVHENRIAILEDGQLVEILVERPEEERTVGNVYKGIVETVLPGMQAAFVNIGGDKNAFLHASDVAQADDEEIDADDADEDRFTSRSRRRRYAPIETVLSKKQEILVQVTKEPLGTKGPRVTTELSFAGRFTVLMPGSKLVGVSRKIGNWSEKRRLKKIAHALNTEGSGLIVRTVASDRSETELEADVRGLTKVWTNTQRHSQRAKAPALVHEELGMTSSLIRDLFTDDIARVVIDSRRGNKEILQYLRSVSPHLQSRVELYKEPTPTFDAFGIEREIERAQSRTVWLKHGGSIVIDHTEALVTIDVNTGKFVNGSDQEVAILQTNLEAAREIARQIRLRDIGGIIVIDFIDMAPHRNRRRVFEEFVKVIKRDRAKTTVLPINDFGLLDMTRQRTRPDLMYTFSEACPICDGLGRVQGRDTTLTKIERWLRRAKPHIRERELVLSVHPNMADYILENDGARLKPLNRTVGVHVDVARDVNLALDQYRVISCRSHEDLTDAFKE
jgi:ribonuclease G